VSEGAVRCYMTQNVRVLSLSYIPGRNILLVWRQLERKKKAEKLFSTFSRKRAKIALMCNRLKKIAATLIYNFLEFLDISSFKGTQ
jgi:hypothetical protein